MENRHPSYDRKALEQELARGHDMANQLLEVLVHKYSNTHHGDVEGLMLPFAKDLVHKVLTSFTNTLLLLNSDSDDVSGEEVLPNFSSSANFPKPEDTDEACKSSFMNAKNRRGCYKRKLNALTWERDSSTLIEDGYAWRKYGQKRIMNTKYLRSYYRCTHKDDQNCPAIKQVQRIQEDPPLYRTTYYGHHNCKSFLNAEMILETNTSFDSSVFLTFNNSLPSKEYSFSSSLFPSTKHEPMEVIPDYHISHNKLHSTNCALLCDNELDFDYLRRVLSSTECVQFGNVYGHCLNFDG
ncbi:WRKY domain [Sesbania bispinosa]|nr:WRKY domain [Sesbania bispinosa]